MVELWSDQGQMWVDDVQRCCSLFYASISKLRPVGVDGGGARVGQVVDSACVHRVEVCRTIVVQRACENGSDGASHEEKNR